MRIRLILSTVVIFTTVAVYGGNVKDLPSNDWEVAVGKRIDIMGTVRWKTLKPMAKCFYTKDAMFKEGEEHCGLPYSAVHQFCGYVGRDVSFFTFLSAMHNPNSSMYKVNYHLMPYDLPKAGPFYGTVCTATATYVWGLPCMLWTKYIRSGVSVYLDDIGNDVDSLRLYDGLCYWKDTGHIIIISGITRDENGRIVEIETFEGTGPYNKFRLYTRDRFEALVAKRDAHFYRYDHEKWGKYFQLPQYMENEPLYDFNFNEDLSPEDGERITFRKDKAVRIDILNGNYSNIELYRGGVRVKKEPVGGRDIVEFAGLPAGFYRARLSNPGKSGFIEFEVADTECVTTMENGILRISGLKNGLEPLAVYFNGERSAVTRLCRNEGDGSWTVPDLPDDVTKLRIHFAGRYSGILGDPVKIRQDSPI